MPTNIAKKRYTAKLSECFLQGIGNVIRNTLKLNTLQKGIFRVVKGALLHRKRASFAS